MDSQNQNLEAAEHTLPLRWLRLACGVICVLPFCIQAVFFDGGFYYDDAFHLQQCEQIADGTIAWSDYVFLAHGEHLIPIWK